MVGFCFHVLLLYIMTWAPPYPNHTSKPSQLMLACRLIASSSLEQMMYDVTSPLDFDYLWQQHSKLFAISFGGSMQVMIHMSDVIDDYFVHYLDQGLINNEQNMPR